MLPHSAPDSHSARAVTASRGVLGRSPSKINDEQRSPGPPRLDPYTGKLGARRCWGASVTIPESDTNSQAGVQIAHYSIVAPREDSAAQPSNHGIHVTESTHRRGQRYDHPSDRQSKPDGTEEHDSDAISAETGAGVSNPSEVRQRGSRI